MFVEGFEGVSETCDFSSCFHMTSCCLGLGPEFLFKSPHSRVHHFCLPELSVAIVSLTRHCFTVPVYPSCYKILLKLTAFRPCHSKASKTFA